MAAGTVATAAGAVVLLYCVLIRRLAMKTKLVESQGGEICHDDLLKSSGSASVSGSRRKRVTRRPAQAPATLLESITTLSETLRFTYSETLGKWPIGDLAFGIKYFMRKQGNLQVASVYAGSECVQLKGLEIIEELKHFLRLLTLCMLFSKKPFPVFLESAGYLPNDVLLQKPKAALLKPAFTIICDKDLKCFLLLIRGTHSMKDTLTAVTGAVVPFHHSVLQDGGLSNLILGYAHCGMVAAARWIAKLSTPTLLKVLAEYPDFKLKVVGHSLGGGTAAILTYILREQKEFSSCTCVTFAPAACMTWELAESGKDFITTVINGTDLVPTFSTASIDDLRSEVMASSWLNDLRDQVEQTKGLNIVYRSATALGSRLPSIATTKARIAGAGALLWPVTNGTQVAIRGAQNVAKVVVRTRSSLSSWSCMTARRRNVGPSSTSRVEDSSEVSLLTANTRESPITEDAVDNVHISDSSGSGLDDSDEDDHPITLDGAAAASSVEDISEGALWHALEKELERQESRVSIEAVAEEAAAAKEITEEANMLAEAAESSKFSSSDITDNHRFYPPGRIMHMVALPSCTVSDADGRIQSTEEHVGLYETPRKLYTKLRLSRTMINDHYMPMYKKMMELLIKELEKDESFMYVM